MSDWRASLPGFLDRAWREIEDIKTRRGGLPALISLATVTPAGQPELRTVVLRRAERAAAIVEAFTDSATSKVTEISTSPAVSALIWQPLNGLQIRLRGTAQVVGGDTLLQDWQNIPDNSRKNYGVTPVPGTEIEAAHAYERIPVPNRLAKLQITISEMDVVHLDPAYDIRAVFRRADDWQGRWLAP